MAQRSKVGHYDIVGELGRGGMGVVYKGFESSLGRNVAIKMLSEALADDAMVVERFFREARSMAQLNDPHIVQIYFVGEDQGQPFFAMEFVNGESLSQRLKREHRLEPFEAARLLLQVSQGLATAHDRGVVHRDIKPANLLITDRGVVKVADFGIALASQDFNKKLTGTGQFVGTPGYLSPEVCLGKPVDQRSDIFALGIVFFEMLTGQTPFQDESPLGMMLEVVQADIPDVRRINDSVDPGLSEILKHMVAKEPADRYADCHQLIADLVAAGVNAATPVTASRPHASVMAGTAVNLPTPPEMRRPPTPAPVVVAAPVYQTVPSAERALPPAPPVLAAPAPPPPKKPSMLPWAAAVGLLIAGGAGAAWYLGGSAGLFSASPVVATSQTDAPAQAIAVVPDDSPTTVGDALAGSTETAVSANTDVAALTPASGNEVASNASEATGTAAVAAANPAAESLAQEAVTGTDAMAAATPEQIDTATALAEAASDTESGQMPRAGATSGNPSPQSAAIGARLSDMREQRRERRDALASNKPRQVAKATVAPRPSEPAYQGPPRVMVVGFGDPAVAGIAEMAIEERLSEMGLDLVDEDLVNGLSGVEDGRPDVARLMASAARNADYVVAIRVEPTGQIELPFHGQSVTQYSARMDIAAYDVKGSRKLGTGWSTPISFTHATADPNTREAISPLLGRIAHGLGARGRG